MKILNVAWKTFTACLDGQLGAARQSFKSIDADTLWAEATGTSEIALQVVRCKFSALTCVQTATRKLKAGETRAALVEQALRNAAALKVTLSPCLVAWLNVAVAST